MAKKTHRSVTANKRKRKKDKAPKADKAKPQVFRGAQLMRGDEDEHVGEDTFSEISDLRQRLYLRAIAANGPRYGLAARAAGVDSRTGYVWRTGGPGSSPEFLHAFEQAMKMGVERCEAELIRRGIKGMEKPVYQQGRLVGTVQEYDTTAAIFMLKAMAPERHRERYEHSGPKGGPIQVATANLTVHALAALPLQDLQERLLAVAGAIGAPLPPMALPGGDLAPQGELEARAAAYRRELEQRGGQP